MVALSVVVLYLASMLPTLRLVACAVASVIVCMAMIKYGVGGALLVYIASAFVSLIIVPNKMLALGYALFFGNYPIVKAYIERINNITFEWVVKIVMFALYAVIAYSVIIGFFPDAVFAYSKPVIFGAALVVEVIYDVALSLLITEVRRRFSKIM